SAAVEVPGDGSAADVDDGAGSGVADDWAGGAGLAGGDGDATGPCPVATLRVPTRRQPARATRMTVPGLLRVMGMPPSRARPRGPWRPTGGPPRFRVLGRGGRRPAGDPGGARAKRSGRPVARAG